MWIRTIAIWPDVLSGLWCCCCRENRTSSQSWNQLSSNGIAGENYSITEFHVQAFMMMRKVEDKSKDANNTSTLWQPKLCLLTTWASGGCETRTQIWPGCWLHVLCGAIVPLLAGKSEKHNSPLSYEVCAVLRLNADQLWGLLKIAWSPSASYVA